jgi:hypothetical protein
MRNEEDKTYTTEALTASALRDPNDRNSFILDFAFRTIPDPLTIILNQGFSVLTEEMKKTAGLKPSDIVDLIRTMQTNLEPRFQQLTTNPSVVKNTVKLEPKA